jgi:hypothetical protein
MLTKNLKVKGGDGGMGAVYELNNWTGLAKFPS